MKKIVQILSLALIVTSCSVNSKLVCHYAFNGNGTDKSKNGWHLPIDNNQFSLDKNGIKNQALKIDSVPISFKGDSSNYDLPISFSFWIKFDKLNPSILGLGVSENKQTGIWFSLGKSTKTNNKIAINIGNGGRPNPNSRKTFIANQPIKKNKWYHIVATIDRQTNMQIYLDGELQDGFYSGNSKTFKFGPKNNFLGKVWKSDDMFLGSIDDFRIYTTNLKEKHVKKLLLTPK
jgi:hypothetical protein